MSRDDLEKLSPEARGIWLVLFAAHKADGCGLGTDRAIEICKHWELEEKTVEEIAELANQFSRSPAAALEFMGAA